MSLRTSAPEGTRRGDEGCPRAWLLALAAVIALTGCAAVRRNQARYDGDRLVRAGFEIQPESLARAEQVDVLPPLQIVPKTTDGHLVYEYADPYRCECVYVGDQYAYRRYRLLVDRDFLRTVILQPLL